MLVLVPKRLRDNWTRYKANDRRNFLSSDRFNYDVLNHTDLSRDTGASGDIDLAHVNWGNYDLVVIDESHNFRNKAMHNTRETRYDRLMRRSLRLKTNYFPRAKKLERCLVCRLHSYGKLRQQPAVHRDHRPRDERGLHAQQKRNHACHLHWFRHTSQRMQSSPLCDHCIRRLVSAKKLCR